MESSGFIGRVLSSRSMEGRTKLRLVRWLERLRKQMVKPVSCWITKEWYFRCIKRLIQWTRIWITSPFGWFFIFFDDPFVLLQLKVHCLNLLVEPLVFILGLSGFESAVLVLDLDGPQEFDFVFLSFGLFLQFLNLKLKFFDLLVALFLNFLLISVYDALNSWVAVDFLFGENLIFFYLFIISVQNIAELIFQPCFPVLVLDELVLFLDRYFLDPWVLEDLLDRNTTFWLENKYFRDKVFALLWQFFGHVVVESRNVLLDVCLADVALGEERRGERAGTRAQLVD